MSDVSLDGHILTILAPERIDGKTALELNARAVALQRRERPGQATDWLSDMSQTKSFSFDARRALMESESLDEVRRYAIVVRSTFVRTVVRFILRAGGQEQRTQFFATRQEALAWLEQPSEE